MDNFFNLSSDLLESLSNEGMALIVGGIDANHQLAEDTVNNATGCGCTIHNGGK